MGAGKPKRGLADHGMRLKLPGAIKQITKGGKYATAKGIAYTGRYIHHLGIEIAYPLHFIFCIRRMVLDDLSRFNDHVCIDAFALEFGYNTKNQSCTLFTGFGFLQPKEFELVEP